MLTSRSAAERKVTSLPPIRTSPEVALSTPAIRRSVVVLPQPEGPSSVTSVPGSMVNEISLTARTAPYCFTTERNSTEARAAWFIALPRGSQREAAHRAAAKPPFADHDLNQQDRKQHHDDQRRRIGDGEAEFAGLDASDDICRRHVPFGGDQKDHGAHRRHRAHEAVDQ